VRALIQRVLMAKVSVSGEAIGEIGPGLLVFLGVGAGDTETDAEYLAEKIANLRIFTDANGKLNDSLLDFKEKMAVLVVSQFTLYADCRKGRRPFFGAAAAPEEGFRLYNYFCERINRLGLKVAQGSFGSHMQVELINDGPVTIWIDSKQ
jgi:D-tyrosyl-tRNA(Tyr) deacylase